MRTVAVDFMDTGKLVVRTSSEFLTMPEEYQALAVRQMLVHVEGELSGADDYISIFYPIAPDTEERQACCERATEEFNHYKIGKAVLADIGVDTTAMEHKARGERSTFDSSNLTTWADRALLAFVGEDAALELLTEMSHSSYRPWADSMRTIIQDEKIHIGHGARIVRTMLRSEVGHKDLQASLDHLWPRFIQLFGHPDSPRSEQWVRYGLRQRTNGQACADWTARMIPRLASLGLTTPDTPIGAR